MPRAFVSWKKRVLVLTTLAVLTAGWTTAGPASAEPRDGNDGFRELICKNSYETPDGRVTGSYSKKYTVIVRACAMTNTNPYGPAWTAENVRVWVPKGSASLTRKGIPSYNNSLVKWKAYGPNGRAGTSGWLWKAGTTSRHDIVTSAATGIFTTKVQVSGKNFKTHCFYLTPGGANVLQRSCN
jgi:hypothetical protein